MTKVICVDRDVHMHPTSDLTTKQVADMYGREVRLLHHAHDHTRPTEHTNAGGTP